MFCLSRGWCLGQHLGPGCCLLVPLPLMDESLDLDSLANSSVLRSQASAPGLAPGEVPPTGSVQCHPPPMTRTDLIARSCSVTEQGTDDSLQPFWGCGPPGGLYLARPPRTWSRCLDPALLSDGLDREVERATARTGKRSIVPDPWVP